MDSLRQSLSLSLHAAAKMHTMSVLVWMYMLPWILLGINQSHSAFTDINDLAEARLQKAINFEGRIAIQPKVPDKPTNVKLSFSLISVQELNIAKQVLSVNGIFTVSWKDPFLRWNISDYEKITYTYLPVTWIWTPPFDITNSINQGQLEASWQKDKVTVMFDGQVWWYPSGTLNVACSAKAFYFPFDTQRCHIYISQRDSVEDDFILTGLMDDGGNQVENWEWNIIDHEVRVDRSLGHDRRYFTRLRFSYTLKRQSTSHVLTIISPVVLLFCVGLMVFALPADSGEKISLGVACLMSFFIMQLNISQEIPKSWQSVPIIMIFNSAFMLLNALSVCVTVLVLNLHHRQSDVQSCLQKGLVQNKSVVHDSDSKMESVEGNEMAMSGITSAGEGNGTNVILSAILKEIQNVRDDLNKKPSENDEHNLHTWRHLADVVNKVLCVIYVLSGVILGMLCLGFWSLG